MDFHRYGILRRSTRRWSSALSVRTSGASQHEFAGGIRGGPGEQKVSAQPRAILSAILGVELREYAESSWCCGSAGIFDLEQKSRARADESAGTEQVTR